MTIAENTRTETPDPREDKLPKWAQIELGRLRADLERAEARAQEMAGGTDAVDVAEVVADPHAKAPLVLPRGVTVRFNVRPGEWNGYVDVRLVGDRRGGRWLDVQGADAVAAFPEASNRLQIAVRDRR